MHQIMLFKLSSFCQLAMCNQDTFEPGDTENAHLMDAEAVWSKANTMSTATALVVFQTCLLWNMRTTIDCATQIR